MNTRQTRLILLGLAFGVLLALLIVPQTRWLVRLQTLTALRLYYPLATTSYTASAANDMRLYQAVAARHPDDFLIQYGHAVMVQADDNIPSPDAGMETHPPDVDQAVLNLRELTRRFPNNPALYANLLRYEMRNIHFSRPDDYLLYQMPLPANVPKYPAPSSEAVAACDRDAALGERLDPDNAYFSLMRAYGLFAAHRDTEALAEVESASDKTLWREYLTEDDEAQWRLHTEAFGDPSALAQASIAASQLLWQYERQRAVARIVVRQAIHKEQAGYPEEGLALREALRRCGDLMRVQSTTAIGSLVGIAVSAIAEMRPGGAPLLRPDPTRPPEQGAQRRLDAYCAYVTKIGHPAVAQRAREEEAARRSIQSVINYDRIFSEFTRPLRRLADWWLTDVALLMNIGWLLGLGLVAAGLNWLSQRRQATEKPPRDWKALGIQGALALGLWLLVALFLVLVLNFWNFSVSDSKALVWRVAFGLLGAFGLVFWWTGRALRRMPAPRRRAVLRTAAYFPLLAGILYGLNYWMTQQQGNPLVGIAESLRMLTTLSGNESSNGPDAEQMRTFQLSVAASLAVPLLAAFSFSLLALLRRNSFARTLVTGFQTYTVPTVCLLVIVYGGLLLETARQERLVSEFNHQIVYEGGRYFAAQAGQPWPGPVR